LQDKNLIHTGKGRKMKRALITMGLIAVGLFILGIIIPSAADAEPVEEWVARYNGPGNYFDVARAIAVDSSSGNVYVTGFSYGSGTGSDYATVAYDSDGNELWVARYNGPGNHFDYAWDIAVDPSSGNVYVTGYSYSGTGYDYATVAYDSDGNELWVARYNGPGNRTDMPWDIAVDPSTGNVYVTGVSPGSGTGQDYATVAYDSFGNELWVARYNRDGSGADVAYAISVDPSSGNIYVTGLSDIDGTSQYYNSYGPYPVGPTTTSDYATVAYDSSGNELWVARYNGPGSYADIATAIAVDRSTGNVHVTGQSYGSSTGHDYATVAYDSSGNELWVARYSYPGSFADKAYPIAVDPSSGNIYVTGITYGGGTATDFTTVAYDSFGNELWVARYNCPEIHYGDRPYAIAVDPTSGNIYVTGSSGNSKGRYDYATVAYDSSGNELWVARYSSTENSHDYATAMAVDPTTGDVYVTGLSDENVTIADFATIKYSLSPPNHEPVTNAGADQNVTTGSLVMLDGSGSSDADGDVLTYSWSFISNPGNAVLSDSTAVNPTFTPNVDGTYVLSLVVSDGNLLSAADTVTIVASSGGGTEPGLVAYYPFNGNANDESGNGNHGTVNGATLAADKDGNADSAYSFDGVNDIITVSDSNTLDTGDFSFSLWIKANGIGRYEHLLDKYSLSTGFFVVNIDGPWYLHYNGYVVGSTSTIDVGNWQHMAGTYDGTTLKIYINGALENSKVPHRPLVNSNDRPLMIGSNGLGNFNGIMDEVRIYNYALSADEILALSAHDPNTAPVADAGDDQSVTTGSLVTLDGSGSSDEDGDALTYSWSFISNSVNATLSDSTAASPTFTPNVDGVYTLSLTRLHQLLPTARLLQTRVLIRTLRPTR
jgi:hypothetical protein